MTEAFTELRYEEADHVGVVTLDRPEARNALTFTTYAELEQVVRTTTARCLVITGADPAFCSGDDVKQVMVAAGSGTADRLEATPRLTPAADALLHTDVPVVAAVNGAAVGWGMELALMADIRVASERARFGELFVKRGLCCDVPGLGRLAQAVGRERASELLFTGRLVGAIAANPPLAVQRLKAGLRRALDPDWRDLGSWVSATLGELFRTEDHREGVQAFLEKREPRFAGR
jgi:enoyl-CoA hydratase/carnithine racemase